VLYPTVKQAISFMIIVIDESTVGSEPHFDPTLIGSVTIQMTED
jgi:hypothetical protein